MKVTTFEGTVEEYAAYLKLTREMASQPADAPRDLPAPSEPPQGASQALVEFLIHVIKRRGIPYGQRDVFAALYEAGDRGLTGAELAAKTNRTRRQLVGVLGAFGNRIGNTPGAETPEKLGRPGHSGIGLCLDITPTDDGGWRYRMLPELRAALEQIGFVKSGPNNESPQSAKESDAEHEQ